MKRRTTVLLILAACGGIASEPTTADTTTTTIGTTTTKVEPPTSVPSPKYHFIESDLLPPPPLPGSNEAAGSGCDPGERALPDGIWFGVVGDVGNDSVLFDMACFFIGEAANQAAAADGVEEVPVPNDYYVRNQNDTTRALPADSDTVVHTLGDSTQDGYEMVTLNEWPAATGEYLICPGDGCIVWIYVNDGQVTEIVEQYVP